MSAKKVTKVDVTYRNGFMLGRMVAIDESEGFDVPIPGVEVRIRVSAIIAYTYGAPNCLLVSFGEEEEAFQVWGTMEAMDEVVARDRLMEAGPVAAGDFTAQSTPPPRDAGLEIVPWTDPDKSA